MTGDATDSSEIHVSLDITSYGEEDSSSHAISSVHVIVSQIQSRWSSQTYGLSPWSALGIDRGHNAVTPTLSSRDVRVLLANDIMNNLQPLPRRML